MKSRRLLGIQDNNYYHIMSRVVNRDHIFGDIEKEFFRLTMRKLERFMGLHILTYCVMGNHWHILIEVPSQDSIPDDILLSRITGFYSRAYARSIVQEYDRAKEHKEKTGSSLWLDEWRIKYTSRMGDLSSFVKELKERFSRWYNRQNNRKGTLWEERFKSVLVENSDHTLTTMAAYIDLNPVRAGIVEDPLDYRFCGYAEAVAGSKTARAGIKRLLALHQQQGGWRKVSEKYRTLLFYTGEKTNEKSGFEPDAVLEILKNGGELTRYELLRCHIRYFNDGVALGSRLFVEKIFQENRRAFSSQRKNGARKIRGVKDESLFTLRDLKLQAITPGSG